MIEAWKANPDLARRRLIDNLVGKPPAYLADRGEKASFFLSIFLGPPYLSKMFFTLNTPAARPRNIDRKNETFSPLWAR